MSHLLLLFTLIVALGLSLLSLTQLPVSGLALATSRSRLFARVGGSHAVPRWFAWLVLSLASSHSFFSPRGTLDAVAGSLHLTTTGSLHLTTAGAHTVTFKEDPILPVGAQGRQEK